MAFRKLGVGLKSSKVRLLRKGLGESRLGSEKSGRNNFEEVTPETSSDPEFLALMPRDCSSCGLNSHLPIIYPSY